VLLGHYTHNPRWDAAGSIAIGILLVVVAFILGVEMKALLLGETASKSDRVLLSNALRNHPQISEVIYMHTEHLGPDTLLVATKAIFEPSLSAEDVSRIIDEAEVAMRAAVPSARFIFIEPDMQRVPR
jgi:divalent metal cation (Fe/Co/Zn/Cd) transporter